MNAWVRFVEQDIHDSRIKVAVYVGGELSAGDLSLTLDEWSWLREQPEESPIVAITASEYADIRGEVPA